MANKIKLGIIFGGKSTEHKVSLMSAKNVYEALDKNKYEITLIGVARNGKWHLCKNSNFLNNENDPNLIELNISNTSLLSLLPYKSDLQLINHTNNTLSKLDVIMPLIHGRTGEDGALQGLLELTEIPYVGPNTLSSAISMDKDITKRLLRDAKIPVTKFITVHNKQSIPSFENVSKNLSLPLFIKPANSGSSIGVSKVTSESKYRTACNLAFSYDNKILIEQGIIGREIEFSILGNKNPNISLPGEITTKNNFYSYDSKYISQNKSTLKIPANISLATLKKMQKIALSTYTTLSCKGMARVDMFLTENLEIYVNEVNTIPGFTQISMYPKLWHASGISYPELLDQLITFAFEQNLINKKLSSYIKTEEIN